MICFKIFNISHKDFQTCFASIAFRKESLDGFTHVCIVRLYIYLCVKYLVYRYLYVHECDYLVLKHVYVWIYIYNFKSIYCPTSTTYSWHMYVGMNACHACSHIETIFVLHCVSWLVS